MAAIREHLVLIPTQDRPHDLYRTVESVFRNMKKFGRKNVRIIVLDDSRKPESFAANLTKLQKAAKTQGFDFSKHVLYYGPAEQKAFLSPLKKKLGVELQHLIPEKKSFGRARNFLALTGIYHGSEKTAFHWLDDDTSLHQYVDSDGKKLVRPLQLDFFNTVEAALKETGHASGGVEGIPDRSLKENASITAALLENELSSIEYRLDHAGNSIERIENDSRKLLPVLRNLRQGRIPLITGGQISMLEYIRRGLGCNRSLLYKPFKLVPFPVGVVNEDKASESDLEGMGYAAVPHGAKVFHWYGKQNGAIPIMNGLSGVLSRLTRAFPQRSARSTYYPVTTRLVRELEAYRDLPKECLASSPKTAARHIPGETMSAWKKAVKNVELLRASSRLKKTTRRS